MSKSTVIQLKFPKRTPAKAAIKAVTQPKGTTPKVGLATLKRLMTRNPIDSPLILRKKKGGTADGRFDNRGSHKYRLRENGSGKPHKGVDLKGKIGDDVYAVASGVVEYIRDTDPYVKGKKGGEFGKYVQIHHGDNLYSQYSHLSKISVKKGEKITFSDVNDQKKIGEVGKTGNVGGEAHLHLEIFTLDSKNGKWKDRHVYDPALIFQFAQEEKPTETN
ncbi:M23 family metallopeptidase [uncultured Dokdonia sp.]|uniref:M23 family metallopeptidase n=1 Tax=uncultured Dokdonia sp. TaxID=575653 RepID=UPI002612BC07|nr:M23 family metallopeptidase [uncultured Dokdonia sp.]